MLWSASFSAQNDILANLCFSSLSICMLCSPVFSSSNLTRLIVDMWGFEQAYLFCLQANVSKKPPLIHFLSCSGAKDPSFIAIADYLLALRRPYLFDVPPARIRGAVLHEHYAVSFPNL